MCGLVGVFGPDAEHGEASREALRMAAVAIQHRGPNDSGVWQDDRQGIGLAHRRLAIQDLSPLGHQPMHSFSGRFVIAFNGEIYNFRQLREELIADNKVFVGESDTEVLLAGIESWGLAKTLSRCHGMFAFALWDVENSELTLARDRMGEKPLYYGQQQNSRGLHNFIFASELKALRALDCFQGDINRHALGSLLRYGNVATPHSIYTNIFKLEPGYYLTIKRKNHGFTTEKIQYWSYLQSLSSQGQASSLFADKKQVIDELDQLLTSVIRRQLIADVPVGALLSGGIDSSLVVAIAQSISKTPIQTFSIGFNEEGFDEAHHAAAVSKHLGTTHTELYVSESDARGVIPDLPQVYDEPFADWSQIPTFLVAKMASGSVRVALSGDGGDELFSGYSRYAQLDESWAQTRRLPATLALAFCRLMELSAVGNGSFANRLRNRSASLYANNLLDYYRGNMVYWAFPQRVLREYSPLASFSDSSASLAEMQPIRQMMANDSMQYLPDDILVKVDRAMMANSLEGRIPLLDHQLVEFSQRVPTAFNYADGLAKWPLRQVLYRYVPREMVDRPKMGFGVPMAQWLRGPLRDWAQSLLDPQRLHQQGYFKVSAVQAMWQQHCKSQADWAFQLWPILMFQAWYEQVHCNS